MLHDLEDFRTAWHTQPTTFFRLTAHEMRAGLERVQRRQRRIARGILAAFVGDVISFTMILFLAVTNALEAAGCIWIMFAMGWFARHLWVGLRSAERASEEMVARPSIDAFRASLESRWVFYRSLLSFGVVLPGVALFLIGAVVAQPASAIWVGVTGALLIAGIANGFRIHMPKARAIRQQLAELDRL
jgi:hypothetical protein